MEILSHSNELRLYTRNVHLQLETRLIPIIRKVRTRSQYEFLLKTFYTFFAPLEKRLCTVSTLEQLTTALQLRKADSLYRDIISLNGSTENLALCENLPDCSNLSEALGIMYVLEGSVLGGKAIANIISKNMKDDPSLPFSFFLYYGDEPQAMWNKFRHSLDSDMTLSKASLLSSAFETFTKFEAWIDKRYNMTHDKMRRLNSTSS